MSQERTKTGKRRVSFTIREAFHDLPVTVPCGTCLGCKLERARQWSVRISHEASLYTNNCFVTLTYKKTPPGGSLRPRDFVLFMKRLRKTGRKVRFIQAGEYGNKGRPHHHAILFNCAFPDMKPFKKTASGSTIYRSTELEKLWPHGFSSVGTVTTASAAYVARYTIKKTHEGGQLAPPRTLPLASDAIKPRRQHGLVAEYITMSRRPGIGHAWLQKYYTDVYPNDVIISREGHRSRPPRYYDEIMKERDPRLFQQLKRRRIDAVNIQEQNSNRALQRQTLDQRRTQDYLKRNLE